MAQIDLRFVTQRFSITDKTVFGDEVRLEVDGSTPIQFIGDFYNYSIKLLSTTPVFDDGNFTKYNFECTLTYAESPDITQEVSITSRFIETSENNGDVIVHGILETTRQAMTGFLSVKLNESDNNGLTKYVFFMFNKGSTSGPADRTVISKRVTYDADSPVSVTNLVTDLDDGGSIAGGQSVYTGITENDNSYDIITCYVPEP